MNLRDSASLRLVVSLLVVYLSSTALIFFFLEYQLESTLAKGVDLSLQEERNLLQVQYHDYGMVGLRRSVQGELDSDGSQHHAFRVIARNRRIILQPRGKPLPTLEPFSGVREMDLDTDDDRSRRVRVMSFPVGDGMTGFIATSMGPVGSLIDEFRYTFLVTSSLVSLFGLELGILLARRFRGKIEAFNRHTRQIVASGDLSSRMPVSGRDEFCELAANMNAMLERIEKLVQGIHQVSDNIAHDLRTPLTRLRADVQVSLQQKDAAQHRDTLERVLLELEKMQAIFNSLLAISRAESGGVQVKRTVVNFSGLLAEMLELYGPSAEDHGLAMSDAIAPGLLVHGNRQLLAQVLSNLLDNALKYVPQGGKIRVTARLRNQHVRVLVEDSGPGIPDDMHEKVFERFARLDPSRTVAGVGLGLSLAKAFVELHHGKLRVGRSKLGGSAFGMDFPAAQRERTPEDITVAPGMGFSADPRAGVAIRSRHSQ